MGMLTGSIKTETIVFLHISAKLTSRMQSGSVSAFCVTNERTAALLLRCCAVSWGQAFSSGAPVSYHTR